MAITVTKTSRYVDKNSVMGGLTTSYTINNSSTTIINQTGGGGVIPVSFILEWDTTNSYYKPYVDKAAAGDEFSAGKLYLGTGSINKPTGTQYTLNYDGYFRPTKLYAAEAEVQFVSTIQGLQFDAIAANPGNTTTLWTSNEDDKLYFGASPVITGLIDNILEFTEDSAGNYYKPYAAHPGTTTMQFYLGTINPTGTTRLNLNANLYTNGLTSQGDIITNNSSGVLGTYIGLFKSAASLPGYPTAYAPVLKTDHTTIYFSAAGKASGSIGGGDAVLALNDTSAVQKVQLHTGGDSYLNGGNVGIGSNANINEKLTVFGKIGFTAGASSTHTLVGGILKTFYTEASTSGTGETDLYSYTLPANVLATNGDMIIFNIQLDVQSSPTTSVVKLYFGGSYIPILAGATIGGYGETTFKIIRKSSSICELYVILAGLLLASIQSNATQLTSQDFTTTNVVKITGQCATETIIARSGFIEYLPAGVN
jgi:hypothetical protein